MDQEKMLQARPHQNRAMKIERQDGGALLTVPLHRPWWARRPLIWLIPLSRERHIELDPIGFGVLSLCDGKHTVADLIAHVEEQYHLSFQEARVSVMQFMGMLMERGAVALVAPPRES